MMKKFLPILGILSVLCITMPLTARAQRRAAAGQVALVDSTTGTPSATIAPGTGVQTVAVPIIFASLANGDVLTNYTPGYKFKLLSVSVAVSKPATTAAKAATLNLEIGTTDV